MVDSVEQQVQCGGVRFLWQDHSVPLETEWIQLPRAVCMPRRTLDIQNVQNGVVPFISPIACSVLLSDANNRMLRNCSNLHRAPRELASREVGNASIDLHWVAFTQAKVCACCPIILWTTK
jgi:hypothetical protein